MRKLAKFAMIATASGILQYLALRVANIERGYTALGSEALVFPAMVALGYFLTGIGADRQEAQQEEAEDKEQHTQGRKTA